MLISCGSKRSLFSICAPSEAAGNQTPAAEKRSRSPKAETKAAARLERFLLRCSRHSLSRSSGPAMLVWRLPALPEPADRPRRSPGSEKNRFRSAPHHVFTIFQFRQRPRPLSLPPLWSLVSMPVSVQCVRSHFLLCFTRVLTHTGRSDLCRDTLTNTLTRLV